jgi:hypothetical protein
MPISPEEYEAKVAARKAAAVDAEPVHEARTNGSAPPPSRASSHTTNGNAPPPDVPRLPLDDWACQAYYDKNRKDCLVLDSKGDWYAVTETQLRRQCKVRGMIVKPSDNHPIPPFDFFLANLQDERGIHYAGPLAGHKKGHRTVNGVPILVTSSPEFIEPMAGEWRIIRQLITGMFDDSKHDQLSYFFGWLKSASQALRAGVNKPGQVLVLAGPAEAGKSFLQTIITWTLGGREVKPYAYMTGSTDFNAQLFGAEHLRLDDEQASTDMRARRAFGARIKELLFGHAQRMHGKHRDELTLDPIWRMTISVNDEPEHLLVLPPIDESLEDKLIILRVSKKAMPMPTETTEQIKALTAAIKSELPAFIHFLMNEHEIDSAITNQRCGIRHWHHPELMKAIRELSPQARLLSLIDMEINPSPFWEGTAEELEHLLVGSGSTVKTEAQRLFAWNNACGTFLGRLARDVPERVERVRKHEGRVWRIYPTAIEN